MRVCGGVSELFGNFAIKKNNMNDDRYLRSIKDLEKVGSKWWPKEVRDEAMKVSILQYLLGTQEKFISLLTLADRNKPEKLFSLD